MAALRAYIDARKNFLYFFPPPNTTNEICVQLLPERQTYSEHLLTKVSGIGSRRRHILIDPSYSQTHRILSPLLPVGRHTQANPG